MLIRNGWALYFPSSFVASMVLKVRFQDHKQQQHLCELVRNTNSPGLPLDPLNQTLWGQGPALLCFNEPSRGFGGSSCENLPSSLKSFPGFDASASFL